MDNTIPLPDFLSPLNVQDIDWLQDIAIEMLCDDNTPWEETAILANMATQYGWIKQEMQL